MTIIDSQVHAYEANTPKRPWHSVPNSDRLSYSERAMLLGGACAKAYRWSPKKD
jgi:hypothetical protein